MLQTERLLAPAASRAFRRLDATLWGDSSSAPPFRRSSSYHGGDAGRHCRLGAPSDLHEPAWAAAGRIASQLQFRPRELRKRSSQYDHSTDYYASSSSSSSKWRDTALGRLLVTDTLKRHRRYALRSSLARKCNALLSSLVMKS
eukprot:GHVU01033451.1.p1 GENE.GHVU01033451.1~~GHVU01033451.1.p1  ORF type:complete len:144 (-),score=15.70 GHVU01033451.1:62-493(-)